MREERKCCRKAFRSGLITSSVQELRLGGWIPGLCEGGGDRGGIGILTWSWVKGGEKGG